MKEITEKEKKKIMLQIMDEIDSYCRHNNLKYFLVGGTLLGAVRHNGFIPWDDDMDIGLPRDDYNYLINNFSGNSGNVKIISHLNSKKYIWPNAKAIDVRTVLIEQNNHKNPIGVFIDIFPFDYFSGTIRELRKEVRKKEFLKNILVLKHVCLSSNRMLIKNIIILFKFLFFFSDVFLIKKINSCKFSGSKDSKYICNFAGAWGLKEISMTEYFNQTTEKDFEGRNFFIPSGYDNYLKSLYGDYMVPPPANEQKSHHLNKAYWR